MRTLVQNVVNSASHAQVTAGQNKTENKWNRIFHATAIQCHYTVLQYCVFFPEPALGQTLNASEKTAVEEQGSNNWIN